MRLTDAVTFTNICIWDMEIFYFISRPTIVVYGQAPDQDHYLIFVEEKRKKTNGKLGKLSFQFRL